MFDPYLTWLGISKEQQPPTHYRLLGISPHERDRKTIEEAMIRQTARIRIYQSGPQGKMCSDILNQIAEAGTVLLDPAKRQRYDEALMPIALPGPAPAPAAAVADPLAAPAAAELLWPKLLLFAVTLVFFLSGLMVFLLAIWFRRMG